MLSTKKTFLALLTASLLYESHAAMAIKPQNVDFNRSVLTRRFTPLTQSDWKVGTRSLTTRTNQNVFLPTQNFFSRGGSFATRWIQPTQNFFSRGGLFATQAKQNVVQPTQNFFSRGGSFATQAKQNAVQPTQNFFSRGGSFATQAKQNVVQPTQNFFSRGGSFATQAKQNVVQPTRDFFSRGGSFASRFSGQNTMQNPMDPNQKIRIKTADIPQEVRTLLAHMGTPMTATEYPTSLTNLRVALQDIQHAENIGAVSRGTTQTTRTILQNKYGVTL